MRGSKGFRCVYLLLLTVFVTFGTVLLIRLAELRRGNAFYGRSREAVLSAAPAAPAPPGDSGDRTAAPEEREPGPPEAWELSRRLAQFAEEYPDAVLWLRLPGTPLDNPVMLGGDNRFYLNHLPDGTRNVLGSLFLDYRTGEDGPHLIVYGHNGSGGRMFGLLKQFESQDYFLEHRTLSLAAADAVYACPIFSVRRVDADSAAYRLEFADRGGLMEYIRQAAAESLYQIEADPEDAAGVLTLSTCTGRHSQRLLVQALIREGPDVAGGTDADTGP